jgi:hypothetical protein
MLYHHLLNCGLRLAASVGTDVWLSYSRGPLISNTRAGPGRPREVEAPLSDAWHASLSQ